ncbi:cyclase family protein [Halobaculum sp. D14]|uniref:cyclase family protein n=1 Tax=Halobaculum sp. D14 TaxID=3421642 RepID=UPI003EBA91AC
MTMEDLTRRIESGMSTYPGDPPVGVTPHATMESDGYRVSSLRLGTHTGTHVDAPAHTEPDGATLDEFEPAAFRFDAALVDVTDVGAREAIQPSAVPSEDDCADADLLVFRTGWGRHWGTDRYRDHPFLAPAAAEACADRGLAVGVDTLSPDPTAAGAASPTDESLEADGASTGASGASAEADGVPAHHALLGAGLLIVENLRLPSTLPEQFTVHAYPLRVDADGAPVRAVADVADE